MEALQPQMSLVDNFTNLYLQELLLGMSSPESLVSSNKNLTVYFFKM